GERAHREHEGGLEDRHLALQESAATGDFVAVGLTVSSALRLARKAPRDRGDVDLRAKDTLVDAQRLFEPAKHRLARGPGKRATEATLAWPRGLTDEEQLALDRGPVYDGADHVRAHPAGVELAMQRGQLFDDAQRFALARFLTSKRPA